MSTLTGKAAAEQAAVIGTLMDGLVEGADRGVVIPWLQAEDLDRRASAEDDRAAMEKALSNSASDGAASGALGKHYEEQRIRRDERIARTGRKRMLFGCLETLWRRGLKLDKTASEEEGG